MYEKHRLEWPMAKYFTHPRRIGLIFLINSPTGWEREARKISLSLPSKAVRFLPFGNSNGIHRARRLRIRRNSNPRNPKLSPRSRSTLRLFSSFTSTCSSANSSRNRFSTACRSHCWRGCAVDTLHSREPQVGGFRSALACFRLSLSCPFRLLHTLHLLRPARHYPRVRIQRSSSERQRDFNPPEQRAAQRTLRPFPSPSVRPAS